MNDSHGNTARELVIIKLGSTAGKHAEVPNGQREAPEEVNAVSGGSPVAGEDKGGQNNVENPCR